MNPLVLGNPASTRAAHARHAAIADDVRWLMSTGATAEAIAARLGTTTGALSRRFYRHGQPDLARPFDRVDLAARRAAKRAIPQVKRGMMGGSAEQRDTSTPAPVGAGRGRGRNRLGGPTK